MQAVKWLKAALGAGLLSTVCGTASAAWIQDPSGLCFMQAAYNNANGDRYALQCGSGSFGRPIIMKPANAAQWVSMGGGEGVSLTVSNDNVPWVVNNQSNIYKFVNGNWVLVTTAAKKNNCEGGVMTVSQPAATQDTKIAVANGENIFVIAGDGADFYGSRIRQLVPQGGGFCWKYLNVGARGREIAMRGGANPDRPWLANNLNEIYAWNDTSWFNVGGGLATALDRTYVLATDTPRTIWR
jgi:hypothetical protein